MNLLKVLEKKRKKKLQPFNSVSMEKSGESLRMSEQESWKEQLKRDLFSGNDSLLLHPDITLWLSDIESICEMPSETIQFFIKDGFPTYGYFEQKRILIVKLERIFFSVQLKQEAQFITNFQKYRSKSK